MGKKNHGRFKTKVVSSINQIAATVAADKAAAAEAEADATNSHADAAQPDDTMNIDTTSTLTSSSSSAASSSSSSSSLAPLSPTISLSRPFHPPHDTLLPPLAGTSTPALTPIILPSSKPSSRPLNGRQWRNPTAPPNRSLTTHAPTHRGWTKQQAVRQQRLKVKAKASEIEAVAKEARMEERRKREQRAKVKAENEKKNRVVQIIKDTSKIKRMSRAQLKQIEKA